MTRRTSRVNHDEVRRMVKAVQACGLNVGRIEFDGERLAVIVGSEKMLAENAAPATLETVESISDYKAWRNKHRASGP